MGCTCKGSKKPKTTLPLQVIKFSSQQEWEKLLDEHYESIKSSSNVNQNFSINIINEGNSGQGNLVILIKGSNIEQSEQAM